MARAPHLRPNRGGSLAVLFFLWVVFTFTSSITGAQFVRASSDCLVPAVLAQAAATLFSIARSNVQDTKSEQHVQQKPAHRAWLFSLGLLHLLSSILTFASFGLSGISGTYVIRTLEPLCTCVLLYVLNQRRCSAVEVLLLAVVVGSVGCVVTTAPAPDAVHFSILTSASEQEKLQLPGQVIPVALAFVATLAVSCRSVTSKLLAGLSDAPTGSEFDMFLESAAPGLAMAATIQAGLWALFGIQPMQGMDEGVWGPAAAAVLLTCALTHFAYNAVSFKVLQGCTPVMHGVLNVLKRISIIVACAIMLDRPLTALQLMGVIMANAAAMALSVHQAAATTRKAASIHPSSGGHVSCDTGPAAADGHEPTRKATLASEGILLTRLVYITGFVIVSSAMFAAYVIALQQTHIQHRQQELQQRQQQQSEVLWPSNSSSSNSAMMLIGGSSSASAVAALEFAVKDLRRVECLTALHDKSKASLAPFLQNRTEGGVALFDVALHKNLGDAMLWAAAARLVPQFHQSVKYVCALSQYPGRGQEAQKHFPKCHVKRMLGVIGPQGVVLLAPGGNWGDLWWFVHSQRLRYLQDMSLAALRHDGPPFQVVQLPQSISFSDPTKMKLDQLAVNTMPQGMLTLFARQSESMTYAQQHYPKASVLPAPDLAFSLGPLMGGEPTVDILFLMRGDKEAAATEAGVGANKVPGQGKGGVRGTRADSRNASSTADVTAAAASLLDELQQLGITYTMREWNFAHENYTRETSKVALTQIAESRLQGAVDIISQGKVVVTNRLHAAIMANLVGRPLIWIDTAHKKLSGVRSLAFSLSDACSEANMHSQQASSFAEAVHMATGWLQSPTFIWSIKQVGLLQQHTSNNTLTEHSYGSDLAAEAYPYQT